MERVLDHLDLLENRIKEGQRLLCTSLEAELATVRLEVRCLAEAPVAEPDDYAARVAVQVAELRSRGDAVYAQLQAMLTARAAIGTAGAAPASAALDILQAPAQGDAYDSDE